MAWTHKWYGQAVLKAFSAEGLDLDAGTIKAALVADTYTPNQDTHEYFDDVTGELSGGGYAQVTLTNQSLTYDAGTNTVKFTADPIVFAELNGTFRHIVLYLDDGVGASSSPLISVMSEDTADVTASGNDVTITPHATDGFVKAVVA